MFNFSTRWSVKREKACRSVSTNIHASTWKRKKTFANEENWLKRLWLYGYKNLWTHSLFYYRNLVFLRCGNKHSHKCKKLLGLSESGFVSHELLFNDFSFTAWAALLGEKFLQVKSVFLWQAHLTKVQPLKGWIQHRWACSASQYNLAKYIYVDLFNIHYFVFEVKWSWKPSTLKERNEANRILITST